MNVKVNPFGNIYGLIMFMSFHKNPVLHSHDMRATTDVVKKSHLN